MPLEKAIEEGRFAFGRNATSRQMGPPPHAMPLASASVAVAELFELAFALPSAVPVRRPTASEWVEALSTLQQELRTCTASPAHKYHRDLGAACPWCAIESAGGPDFFLSVVAAVRAATSFDLDQIRDEILGISPPAATTRLPTGSLSHIQPNERPPDIWRRAALRASQATAALAVLIVLGTCAGRILETPGFWSAVVLGVLSMYLLVWSNESNERALLEDKVREADEELTSLAVQWSNECSATAERFQTCLIGLQGLLTRHMGFDNARRHELKQLETDLPERQLHHHLEGCHIHGAILLGIGDGLKETLRSWGIETAADVVEASVARVPGFGKTRIGTLGAWKDEMSSKFSFNQSEGVDPQDIAAVNQKYSRRRQEVERLLTVGPSELRGIKITADQQRARLAATMITLQTQLAQAKADLTAMS
ncbi:hypothetical protein [Gemmatimonas sp.]|uniref:hypothetical protein n=1 Tax=Gemmatimonas sp. TaxID=1962908 RepID=UPI003561A13E